MSEPFASSSSSRASFDKWAAVKDRERRAQRLAAQMHPSLSVASESAEAVGKALFAVSARLLPDWTRFLAACRSSWADLPGAVHGEERRLVTSADLRAALRPGDAVQIVPPAAAPTLGVVDASGAAVSERAVTLSAPLRAAVPRGSRMRVRRAFFSPKDAWRSFACCAVPEDAPTLAEMASLRRFVANERCAAATREPLRGQRLS